MCSKSLYQRPGAGAKHVQSSSKTFGVSEVKLDSGLVHGATQKSAALVCLIGIGKINLYNLLLCLSSVADCGYEKGGLSTELDSKELDRSS